MIYVLGSINMDLVFDMPYIPKNGETLRSKSFSTFCGGKGANQAAAIAKLNSRVEMIGKIGSDTYGSILKKNLEDTGVGVKNVKVSEGSSGLAVILVKNGQNRILLDGGANDRIQICDVDEGLKDAGKGDILVAQLELPVSVVSYALSVAKAKGMITFLNPAPAVALSDEIYKNTDIIAPNETETQILTGVNPVDIVHVALAVKKFYKKGVKNVIITLGARGAAVSHDMNITEIDAIKVKVVDTTAAGDTFVGAVCNRLESGWDIVSACRFANCAASITVQRKGAAVSIPTIDEVEKQYGGI